MDLAKYFKDASDTATSHQSGAGRPTISVDHEASPPAKVVPAHVLRQQRAAPSALCCHTLLDNTPLHGSPLPCSLCKLAGRQLSRPNPPDFLAGGGWRGGSGVLGGGAQEAHEEAVSRWYDLKDPSDFSKTVGRVRVQTQSATLHHLERQFWGRALSIADLDANGTLELHEFKLLMQVAASAAPRRPATPREISEGRSSAAESRP